MSGALEFWSVGRARRAVVKLKKLAPVTVRLNLPDGSERGWTWASVFEPGEWMEVVCRREVESAVDAIRSAVSTGRKGDGMIFVTAVDAVIRTSDGSRGPAVLNW